MNCCTKPSYGSYIKIILFGFFLIGLFACKKETSKKGVGLVKTELDSILTWIELGRDTNGSIDTRKEYLVKAYRSAKSEKRDTTRLKYFSKIQWSFFGLQDSLWFRKTNREATTIAQELQDSVRLGGFYWDLAEFLRQNKVKDSAYYHFSRGQKLFKALGDKSKAGILAYDMALIQAEVKDYTGSEINTIKAIALVKPLNDNLMLYRCYNLLGIIAKDLKEHKRSLEYYNVADEYLKKSKARGQFGPEVEINIGVTYHEMGGYEKATSYFKSALNHDSLFIKNPAYYAMALNNLANSNFQIDPNVEVEGLFKKSLKIRDSLGDMTGMASGSYHFSKYYLDKKDTAKALKNALNAKLYAEKSGDNERLLQSLELLTKLDPDNASEHGQKYIALNDSLQQEERKIRNKFARIRFETDEVVAENQTLARQRQLLTGIAVSLFLLGGSIVVIIWQRARNQKLEFEQEQQASDKKIVNLMFSESQKFEEGKKREQKRISEELHDGVLGKMLGARMVLTGLNKKANPEAIAERSEAIAALKDVEGEVRSISHELSHAAYQEIHNFIRSIRDLLKNNATSAKINHNFNYDKGVDWDGLAGDIKINLYRMVQESLQNAVKHSKCKNLTIDFSATDDHLQILIQDDGIGFDLGKRKRGIGMRNIRSRIKKINGTWHIDSRSGSGTSVRLAIPIDYFSRDPQVLDEFEQVEKV